MKQEEADRSPEPEAPPVQPEVNADGVDLSQVRARLAMTPLDRLLENEKGIKTLELLRRGRRR